MIREVDLTEYLPQFMKNYREPIAALKAENPEFQIMWKAADKVLYNHFISKADENGIAEFEKILGIYPTEEDTLESRRLRVQSKWFNKIPYTMRVLLEKLKVLCGDTDFFLTYDFQKSYTLTIDTNLELFGQIEELESMLENLTPYNIKLVIHNSILCVAAGSIISAGGVCYTADFIITDEGEK